MFSVESNDHLVRARLDAMPARVHARLMTVASALAQQLRTHVQRDKLLGQVLHRRTGALGRSIYDTVTSTSTSVTGKVASSGDVVYGRIHEYGLTVHRRMTMAWGRAVKNPRMVTAHYPERSFMRSSLADMREEIIEKLKTAVVEGAK